MSKIIIIGGGMAGLSAGIYGLKSGYDVTIIEKNSEVGGLCTTWERDGAIIDGCIHWLTGCGKSNMIPLYKDLGLFDNCSIIHPQNFYTFHYNDQTICINRKLSVFEDSLKKCCESNDDLNKIKFFIKLIKKMRYMPFHTGVPQDTMTTAQLAGYIKNLVPYAMPWQKMINISLKDFAEGFDSEILKHFFISFMPSYYSITYFVGVIAAFVTGNADTIDISSKDFALQAKEKFLRLGGDLILNSEISNMNLENDTIIYVEDKKGKKYYANYYVAACPLPFFHKNLLPTEYHDSSVDFVFNNLETYPLISTVYVAMTLDSKLIEKLDYFTLVYDEEGITFGSYKNDSIHYRSYPYLKNSDGTTTVIALIDINCKDYHLFLEAKNNGKYEELKNDLANKAKNILIKQFNEFEESLKIVDVATPLTFSKKTNTYNGAYLSNLITPFGFRKTFKYRDDKITNLYYGSQWITEIGGIPCALSNGKFAIDEINYIRMKEIKKMKRDKFIREKLMKKKAE